MTDKTALASKLTQLEIPDVVSQLSIADPDQARAACGITCLWMVLRYLDSSFPLNLQQLHDKEVVNPEHFRHSDGLWLQSGSADYARGLGYRAMSVNLNVLGRSEADIEKMLSSRRITEKEVDDYTKLYVALQEVPKEERIQKALEFFVSRNILVMPGIYMGENHSGSTHRIVCAGYNEHEAIIIDPNMHPAQPVPVSFDWLTERSTGNLLVVYRDLGGDQ